MILDPNPAAFNGKRDESLEFCSINLQTFIGIIIIKLNVSGRGVSPCIVILMHL